MSRRWLFERTVQFYCATRELLLEQQTSPQCLDKDTMLRVRYSVNFEDVSLLQHIVHFGMAIHTAPSFAPGQRHGTALFNCSL